MPQAASVIQLQQLCIRAGHGKTGIVDSGQRNTGQQNKTGLKISSVVGLRRPPNPQQHKSAADQSAAKPAKMARFSL
jgi:hypothetical protein